jgi:predicted membrane channel-forming protein YqfA (hemolysin III family)
MALTEIALRGSYLPFVPLASFGGLSYTIGLKIYGADRTDQADNRPAGHFIAVNWPDSPIPRG